MITRNRVFAFVLVALGLAAFAVNASADSVTFANGDMAVVSCYAISGGWETSLYKVNAAGTEKTKMGQWAIGNTFQAAFDTDGTILVAGDLGLYRVDPRNYTATGTGTRLTISGTTDPKYTGVAVGSAGTIYARGNTSTGAQQYWRLTSTGTNAYSYSVVGPATGIDTCWNLAVESDVAGKAKLLGYSQTTAGVFDLYRFDEELGTKTKLNAGSLSTSPYSVFFDEANGTVYVGSHASNDIYTVKLSDGTTTKVFTGTGAAKGIDTFGGKLLTTQCIWGTSNTLFTLEGTPLSTVALGTVTINAPRSIAVYHAIPEPGTMALLACGLVGLIAYAWRKRK